MSITTEAAAPTTILETAATAEANAAAHTTLMENDATRAEVATAATTDAIGELAMADTRSMTLVSGTVYLEPTIPGQGQPFANWAMSDLRYNVITGSADEHGNGHIPEGSHVRRVQLAAEPLDSWND